MWGTTRTLVANMVKGVSEGFTVDLEINGVGYRAAVQGSDLVLQLGYWHDVTYPIPAGITIKTERPTAISVSGADRQKVGQVAAEIRAVPRAGALQGQGHQVRDEKISAQGRQEEVGARPMKTSKELNARRKMRVRTQIRKKAGGRPRLSVFRSSKHIYAQVIDDSEGKTLAAASTIDKDLREALKTGADNEAAKLVGKLIAERATAAGVTEVVFDRGGYLYHGRVKALADAAREGGLSF